MKKLVLLLIVSALCISLCVGLSACGEEKEPVSNIYMVALSTRNAVLKKATESFTFEALANDWAANPEYQWFRCNEKGVPEGAAIGRGKTYTVGNLDDSQIGNTYYFLCTADDGIAKASLIFRCVREADKSDFLNMRLGTWTDLNSGKYIVVEKTEDGRNTLQFGVWGDAEDGHTGTVSFMEPISDESFKIAVDMPERENEGEHVGDDGEIVHDDFVTLEFIVTENPDKTLEFAGLRDAALRNGTYTNDPRYQMPNPAETFVPAVERN